MVLRTNSCGIQLEICLTDSSLVTQTCNFSFNLLPMNYLCTTMPVSQCPTEQVNVQTCYINTVPIVYQTCALVA